MLNILCVEDDFVASFILHERLERMGHTIIEKLDTGEDALRLCEWLKPDLLLMDIKLAGEMDGLETVERIREIHDIPVIFITGMNDKSIKEKALALKPHAFFTKPVNIQDLQNSIDQLT